MNESAQRKLLWALAATCVVCGSAWSVWPLSTAADRLAAIPLAAGEFQGRDVPLTERELQVLGRVDHLHREYTRGDRSVYVTLIDGSRDRHAVHDPRYCFRGAGWTVLEESSRPLLGGEARWLRAERGGAPAEAAFWFSDGQARHASLPAYLWTTVLRRVTFGAAGGKPVLVVVQSFAEQPMDWAEVETLVGTLGL